MAEKDSRKIRLFKGESTVEYWGDENGGGWRRWVRNYLASHSNIE